MVGVLALVPIGIRNRNPGNIRPSKRYRWVGEIGESGGFCVFDTMANGCRALCLNLLAYYDRGINTIRRAISTWAPPEDNNDTEAYIVAVSTLLEVDDEDKLDFRTESALFWLATAIGEHECGHQAFNQYVTDADIMAGVRSALNS